MDSFPGLRGFGRGTFMFGSPGSGDGATMSQPMTSTPLPGSTTPQVHKTGGLEDLAEAPEPVSPPGNREISVELLAGIVEQVGRSIGESIVSCLGAAKAVGDGVGPQNTSGMGELKMSDISGMSLVLKSDVKEPGCFRGDGSEKCTVQEWEGWMLGYMRKKGFSAREQSDEVMGKLVGRARDIVRVGLRSDSKIDLSQGPGPIFDMLKQHFSDTVYSDMPLADFYATLPLAGEDPFDYWIRLNRAIDGVEDCMKRQGKTLEDPAREVAVMFIRHCPDHELRLIFKCKPLHQWTAGDVHERLEEHRRERKAGNLSRSPALVSTLSQVVSSPMVLSQSRSSPAVRPEPAIEHTTASSPTTPHGSSEPLDRVIALLESVLEQRPQHMFNTGPRPQQRFVKRVNPSLPCSVCGNANHRTAEHCRADNLCFLCYAPGHTRIACPRAASQDLTHQPAGLARQGSANQQGN